ncbi:MAG: site-specific integrase [Salinibacterium sp.]|nr:MAG: site-specific integrase [Salinibacterium sp.]
MTQEKTKDPVAAFIDSLAPTSKPTMRDALELIAKHWGATADTFAWHEVRYEQSQELRTFLMGKYKSRTTNKILAAFRGVLKAAWRLDLMSTDDYHHARDVKVVRICELPAGRRLSMAELRKLVTTGDKKDVSAMFALLYAAGLRKFELQKLRRSDYDQDSGILTIRGKGNKVRQVKIHKEWRPPVDSWLEVCPSRSGEPLFPSSRRAGKPWSLTGIVALIEKQRLRAGVAPFTTHDPRRTLLTNLIDLGVDLVVVKRIAGHEHVETTAAYDRRGREAEDSAIDKLEGL